MPNLAKFEGLLYAREGRKKVEMMKGIENEERGVGERKEKRERERENGRMGKKKDRGEEG